MKLWLGAAAAAAVVAAVAPASAAWLSTGAGAGAASARTMPAGNKPSAAASGQSVTVTWPASAFSGGPNVDGYVVKRYDLLGAAQTVQASCSGVVSATTCTESNVPAGTWKYSVTPAQGTWRGAEGPQSDPVLVI